MGFNLDTPPPSVCEKILHIFVEVFDKSFKPYCNSGKMNLRDEFMLITHGKTAYTSTLVCNIKKVVFLQQAIK